MVCRVYRAAGTDDLADKLRDHYARRTEHDLARPNDFVFGDGRHVKHGALYLAFRAAVKGAGIERDPGKRLSPHSLRHGYGSLLLAYGEQVSNVSAWLGHRKISTTEKWYAHQIETLLDLAADRMRDRERGRAGATALCGVRGSTAAGADGRDGNQLSKLPVRVGIPQRGRLRLELRRSHTSSRRR